jgi:hypothetical protein
MAFNAKNIIIGAAPLNITTLDSTDGSYAIQDPTGLASFATGSNGSAVDGNGDLRSTVVGSTIAAAYTNVGFTNNGLQITYNPTYGSVTVDQLLDTAKLFKESMEVMLATEMSEGTLFNVMTVFGQKSSSKSGTLGASANETLAIAGGALLEAPTERQLLAVGPAPTNASPNTERVYYGRRVLSVMQSQFSLARNTPTTFPVTFRLLPDTTYAGSEYGKIVDRFRAAS